MKPTVPEVSELILAYRSRKHTNPMVLLLTMVADTVSDDTLRECVRYAISRCDADAEAIANKLLRMSKTQRRKIARLT